MDGVLFGDRELVRRVDDRLHFFKFWPGNLARTVLFPFGETDRQKLCRGNIPPEKIDEAGGRIPAFDKVIGVDPALNRARWN